MLPRMILAMGLASLAIAGKAQDNGTNGNNGNNQTPVPAPVRFIATDQGQAQLAAAIHALTARLGSAPVASAPAPVALPSFPMSSMPFSMPGCGMEPAPPINAQFLTVPEVDTDGDHKRYKLRVITVGGQPTIILDPETVPFWKRCLEHLMEKHR